MSQHDPLYTLERVAEVLKVSTGEVNRMREQGQLRGFKDGPTWKFRKDEVEEVLANLIKKKNQQAQVEEEDILTFGLVEEDEEQPTLMADTNQSETGDGLSLDEDDSDLGLGLKLDETDETIDLDSTPMDLAKPGPQLEEDDDLVLGGGSDLNLVGGSGLSLAGSDDEAILELDEDSDILALVDSDGESEVPTTMFLDGGEALGNEFDLIADTDDPDESESSSQVIALDDDSPFGAGELPDFGADTFEETSDFGPVTGSDDFGPAVSETATPFTSTVSKSPGRSPYEATYSGKAVTALGLLCIVPVGFAGLMVYDLVRNIWSWDQPTVLSSPIVDMIAGVLGWK